MDRLVREQMTVEVVEFMAEAARNQTFTGYGEFFAVAVHRLDRDLHRTVGDAPYVRNGQTAFDFLLFAFRRDDCPPGVSDALVAELAREAERRGQTVLNLGLGIDGGIAFFKKKWDAFEAMPHLETSWTV